MTNEITLQFDSDKKRVLIVDEDPLFRSGLASLIKAEPNLVPCCEASSAPLALHVMRTCPRGPCDVAVLDVCLQGANGIELIKLLRAEHPQLKILMLSMYEESVYALSALRAGALGYVMKGEELDQLRSALHKVTSGEIYVSQKLREQIIFQAVNKDTINSALKRLSHKQLEVLKLFGRGLGTREVASQLYVSRRTIETHRMRIKEKLGFTDANEMVRFAIDWYAQEKRI